MRVHIFIYISVSMWAGCILHWIMHVHLSPSQSLHWIMYELKCMHTHMYVCHSVVMFVNVHVHAL